MDAMKHEHGMTMISCLLILTVIGFFIMLGLKVGTVYMEHYSVRQVMKSIQHEPLVSRKPVAEIRKMLERRFDMNSIRSLKRDNVKIRRSGGVTKSDGNYEQRRPIVGNLDVLITFSESIELIAT